MTAFYVELITPDKTLFEGEIISLTSNIEDGEMEILAGFLPSVSYLTAGKCKLTLVSGEQRTFISVDGILDVRKEKTVLASSFLEWEENLKEALDLREKHIEEERKRRQESFHESKLTSVALTKALIKVAGIKRQK